MHTQENQVGRKLSGPAPAMGNAMCATLGEIKDYHLVSQLPRWLCEARLDDSPKLSPRWLRGARLDAFASNLGLDNPLDYPMPTQKETNDYPLAGTLRADGF